MLGVVRKPREFGRIADVDASADDFDHAVFLQFGEAATHRFQREPKVVRDVFAAHRQFELRRGLADVAVALGQAVQEQRDALAGLAPHQHAEVVLVAVHALADDAQQLVLQARQLRSDRRQLVEGHLAHVRGRERDRFATVLARAERVEADQLARQVETDDLFLAFLADAHRLERAVARDVDRVQGIAGPEQALAAFDRPLALDDVVQPLHLVRADAGRQAQLLERAVRAPAAQRGDVEDGVRGHGPMVPWRVWSKDAHGRNRLSDSAGAPAISAA